MEKETKESLGISVWEAEDIQCPKKLERFRIKTALMIKTEPSACLLPRKMRKLSI
jgi:hypothetical protein